MTPETKLAEGLRTQHDSLLREYSQLRKRGEEVEAGLQKAEKERSHSPKLIQELRKNLAVHRKSLESRIKELEGLQKTLVAPEMARARLAEIHRHLLRLETEKKLILAGFAQITEQQEKNFELLDMAAFRKEAEETIANMGFSPIPRLPSRGVQNDEQWNKTVDTWEKQMQDYIKRNTFLGAPAWQPGASGPATEKIRKSVAMTGYAHEHPQFLNKVGAMSWNAATTYQIHASYLDRLQVLSKLPQPTERQAQEAQLLRRMEMVIAQDIMLQGLVTNFVSIGSQYASLVESGEIPQQYRNAYLEQRTQRLIHFAHEAMPRWQQLRQFHHYGNSLVFLHWQIAACTGELATPNLPEDRRKVVEQERDNHRRSWEALSAHFQTLSGQIQGAGHSLSRPLTIINPDGSSVTHPALVIAVPPLNAEEPGSPAMAKWIEVMTKGVLEPTRTQMHSLEQGLRQIFTQTHDLQLTLSNGDHLHLAPHVPHAMLLSALQRRSNAVGQEIAQGITEQQQLEKKRKAGGASESKAERDAREKRSKMTLSQTESLFNTDRRIAGYMTNYSTVTLPMQRQLMGLYATQGAAIPATPAAKKEMEEALTKNGAPRIMPGLYGDQAQGFNMAMAQMGFNVLYSRQQDVIGAYTHILAAELHYFESGGPLDQFIGFIVNHIDSFARTVDYIATVVPHGYHLGADFMLYGSNFWAPEAMQKLLHGTELDRHMALHNMAMTLRASSQSLQEIRNQHADDLQRVKKLIEERIGILTEKANTVQSKTFDMEIAADEVDSSAAAFKKAEEAAQKNNTPATQAALDTARESRDAAGKRFKQAYEAREKSADECITALEALVEPYEELDRIQQSINKEVTDILHQAGVNWRLWESSQGVPWGNVYMSMGRRMVVMGLADVVITAICRRSLSHVRVLPTIGRLFTGSFTAPVRPLIEIGRWGMNRWRTPSTIGVSSPTTAGGPTPGAISTPEPTRTPTPSSTAPNTTPTVAPEVRPPSTLAEVEAAADRLSKARQNLVSARAAAQGGGAVEAAVERQAIEFRDLLNRYQPSSPIAPDQEALRFRFTQQFSTAEILIGEHALVRQELIRQAHNWGSAAEGTPHSANTALEKQWILEGLDPRSPRGPNGRPTGRLQVQVSGQTVTVTPQAALTTTQAQEILQAGLAGRSTSIAARAPNLTSTSSLPRYPNAPIVAPETPQPPSTLRSRIFNSRTVQVGGRVLQVGGGVLLVHQAGQLVGQVEQRINLGRERERLTNEVRGMFADTSKYIPDSSNPNLFTEVNSSIQINITPIVGLNDDLLSHATANAVTTGGSILGGLAAYCASTGVGIPLAVLLLAGVPLVESALDGNKRQALRRFLNSVGQRIAMLIPIGVLTSSNPADLYSNVLDIRRIWGQSTDPGIGDNLARQQEAQRAMSVVTVGLVFREMQRITPIPLEQLNMYLSNDYSPSEDIWNSRQGIATLVQDFVGPLPDRFFFRGPDTPEQERFQNAITRAAAVVLRQRIFNAYASLRSEMDGYLRIRNQNNPGASSRGRELLQDPRALRLCEERLQLLGSQLSWGGLTVADIYSQVMAERTRRGFNDVYGFYPSTQSRIMASLPTNSLEYRMAYGADNEDPIPPRVHSGIESLSRGMETLVQSLGGSPVITRLSADGQHRLASETSASTLAENQGTPAYKLPRGNVEVYLSIVGGRLQWSSYSYPQWVPIESGRYDNAAPGSDRAFVNEIADTLQRMSRIAENSQDLGASERNGGNILFHRATRDQQTGEYTLTVGNNIRRVICLGGVWCMREEGSQPWIPVRRLPQESTADDWLMNRYLHALSPDVPSSIAWGEFRENCQFLEKQGAQLQKVGDEFLYILPGNVQFRLSRHAACEFRFSSGEWNRRLSARDAYPDIRARIETVQKQSARTPEQRERLRKDGMEWIRAILRRDFPAGGYTIEEQPGDDRNSIVRVTWLDSSMIEYSCINGAWMWRSRSYAQRTERDRISHYARPEEYDDWVLPTYRVPRPGRIIAVHNDILRELNELNRR